METLQQDYIKTWIWRLAILTALLVGSLSWLSGVRLSFVVIRMGIAWVVIYGLGMGGLVLFSRGGIPETLANGHEKGSLIDIAVGELAAALSEGDLPEGFASGGSSSSAEGSEEAESSGVSSGVTAEESLGQPSDFRRPGGVPGQIQPELHKGLPDSETQAEMVRRMGWENLSDS